MKPVGWDGPTSAPVMELDGYEGPIDFLLELARAQKVDLGRLSIVALVDQYVAAVEAPGARATLAAMRSRETNRRSRKRARSVCAAVENMA